ncbi:MAG TPA: antitoxin MazE family protein [Novosphingobium sp.]|nr:antitoxin MazE family protein [Novosphingobium sp.]
MGKHEPIPNAERVAKRRAALRAQGLRPRQFWLPDAKDPAWREEMRRQALAIANSPGEADDQAFIDSITDWEGMPPP